MPFFAGMYIPKAHGTCVDLVQLELKQRERDFNRDLIIRLNSLFLITAEKHTHKSSKLNPIYI